MCRTDSYVSQGKSLAQVFTHPPLHKCFNLVVLAFDKWGHIFEAGCGAFDISYTSLTHWNTNYTSIVQYHPSTKTKEVILMRWFYFIQAVHNTGSSSQQKYVLQTTCIKDVLLSHIPNEVIMKFNSSTGISFHLRFSRKIRLKNGKTDIVPWCWDWKLRPVTLQRFKSPGSGYASQSAKHT